MTPADTAAERDEKRDEAYLAEIRGWHHPRTEVRFLLRVIDSLLAVTRICDATAGVLSAADHLVDEYTRDDEGHGTGVGMRVAEDRLIREVKWRRRETGSSK